jgi:hypothetical protein
MLVFNFSLVQIVKAGMEGLFETDIGEPIPINKNLASPGLAQISVTILQKEGPVLKDSILWYWKRDISLQFLMLWDILNTFVHLRWNVPIP